MIFSKATGYGIRALAYMATQPAHRLCGLQEIAEHEDIPAPYLRKVLGELRRHRFLRSVKGIHGGYELIRPAETITLWDVFSVLEPDPYMDTCLLGNRVCNPESACAFHEDWQRLSAELVNLLHTKTISEAAESISKRTTGATDQEKRLQEKSDWKDEDHAIPSPA
jgi:Rrf2 family protein